MDLAGDLSTQGKLKVKKLQDESRHQANVVVNDVLQQVSLKRRVDPTEAEIAAKNEAQAIVNQINYNNIRKGILDRIAQHRMKVQEASQAFAAKVAQKVEMRQMRHDKFLAEEKKRFEVRKAKNNAAISESVKSGIY